MLLTALFALAPPCAQAGNPLRKEIRIAVQAKSDSLIVLDPWIIPGSFSVYADTTLLENSEWTLYPVIGHWYWHAGYQERTSFDSLRFSYVVRPVSLAPVIRHRVPEEDPETRHVIPDTDTERQVVRRPPSQQDLFADTRLERSGSLRRGIVVGSNQDFSMDSGLRFDVRGNITDEWEVVASLTDQSTPIQPEGTTQTLREFDQVYIRLMHPSGSLQMGDVDVQLNQSRFAVINRRLQGVDLTANRFATGTQSNEFSNRHSNALSNGFSNRQSNAQSNGFSNRQSNALSNGFSNRQSNAQSNALSNEQSTRFNNGFNNGLSNGQLHTGTYRGSAAVARGRYREIQFTGVDGVQGPYRLAQAGQQSFLIVLAGSERVYLDGELLTRGEENDYIVDYGLGEVTFTSNRIITDYSRITVDFQYLEDEFTRSLLAAEADEIRLFDGRLTFGATVIREADNVSASSRLLLSENERAILRDAGNDPDKAVVSGADSVGYRRDADFLLYARVDTLFQGKIYTIFRHVPGDSSGVYRVSFSRVDPGSGDYVRVGRAANGILYEWAGPGAGDYMPRRKLPRPMEQSMIALRSQWNPRPGWSLYGEWAGSSLDQNRLSSIDNENNQDMSFLTGFRIQPGKTALGIFELFGEGRYEGEHFAYFDRVREVEFDRRWNLAAMPDSREIRLEGGAAWTPGSETKIILGGGVIDRDLFEGSRADLQIRSQRDGLPGLDYFAERIDSRDQMLGESGKWWRQKARMDYQWNLSFGVLQPEMEFEQEERRQTGLDNDSLAQGSFRFREWGPGLFYEINSRFRAGTSIRYREDSAMLHGRMEDLSRNITQRYILNYRHEHLFQTSNTLGIRSRSFEDLFKIEEQRIDSRGLLIRSETAFSPLDRFIETRILYDANTERRALMQEAYVEVGPELGQYVWIDLNDDGVRQVDEFFPEQSPNEGTFIRQLVPSDELYPVIALHVRWQTTVDPSRRIDPHDARYSRWLGFLSGMLWISTIDVREENRTEQLRDVYLLQLHTFRDDSLTVRGRFFLGQELELLRNDTRSAVRISADRTLGQQAQASGLEHFHRDNLEIRADRRISRTYRIGMHFQAGRSENESETFSSRNYSITGTETRPRLDIRWNTRLQTGLGGAWVRRKDAYPQVPSNITGYTFFADTRLRTGTALHSTASLEFRNFSQSGGPSSRTGELELTAGAGLGNTWAWSLQSDYRVSDFLRAGLQYDGRTIRDRPTVQSLRFTVSAVF